MTADVIGAILALFGVAATLLAGVRSLILRSEARIDARFDRVDERFDRVDERFEKVDERFEHMEEKFDAKLDRLERRIDTKLENLEHRFDGLEDKVERLEDKIERVDEKVERVRDDMHILSSEVMGLKFAVAGPEALQHGLLVRKSTHQRARARQRSGQAGHRNRGGRGGR
ncbi:MAG: hypothetical protein ACK5LO_04275 [Leucobacter sp.]